VERQAAIPERGKDRSRHGCRDLAPGQGLPPLLRGHRHELAMSGPRHGKRGRPRHGATGNDAHFVQVGLRDPDGPREQLRRLVILPGEAHRELPERPRAKLGRRLASLRVGLGVQAEEQIQRGPSVGVIDGRSEDVGEARPVMAVEERRIVAGFELGRPLAWREVGPVVVQGVIGECPSPELGPIRLGAR
jgi:hypothetical protein